MVISSTRADASHQKEKRMQEPCSIHTSLVPDSKWPQVQGLTTLNRVLTFLYSGSPSVGTALTLSI